MKHDLVIIGNRKLDNSLIYKCRNCNKVGTALDGPCTKSYGPVGRKTGK